MGEKEAQRTIMAYAACMIVDGCDLCPLFNEEQERTTQRGICQEQTTQEKLREALTALRGEKEL